MGNTSGSLDRKLRGQRESSFLRRMPAGHHPAPSSVDQVLVIELEDYHSRAAIRGQPNNKRAVIAPGEVFTPGLHARVEERDSFASFGVYAVGLRGLVTVA